MTRTYWIKFQNAPPEKFVFSSWMEMIERLRDIGLSRPDMGYLEWIIYD